ncbi:MAG: hypothetical protein Kow0031_06320 [Anaerolineae bacterium]
MTSSAIKAQIDRLSGHLILCGAGRTGANIADFFCDLHAGFVVIEQDMETIEHLVEYAQRHNTELLYVLGDATEDEILLAAGITRASGLIAALSDDRDNLFATLTARSLNPTLRIVTRVDDERNNREKMMKAGADRVISTDAIGGMRMASELIRPEVVKFLDQMSRVREKEKTLRFTELPVCDIKVPEWLELLQASREQDDAKVCIKDFGRYTGLLVVAIKSPDEADNPGANDLYHMKKRYRFTPRGDVELHMDDILVVIGTQDKLEEVTTGVKQPHAVDAGQAPA